MSGASDRHEVSIDFIGKKLRIDTHWIDLTDEQAKLFACLLQEPRGLRSKAELTTAAYGSYEGKADRRVEDLLRYFKRRRIGLLFQHEELIEEHTFWENQHGSGYRVKEAWTIQSNHEPPAPSVLVLLNRCLTQLYWLIREQRPGAAEAASLKTPFLVLQDLAEACRQLLQTRESDEMALNWFNCMMRVALYLEQHGQPHGKLGVLQLGRQLEEGWSRLLGELWAMEWRAIYLEMVGDMAAAARASEQLAGRAMSAGSPWPFSAALWARAAQCFELVGQGRQAAKLYIQAADLMSRDCRVSIKAPAYYQTALRLFPVSPDRDRITPRLERLTRTLAEREQGARRSIALVANYIDADLADVLVHPLSEQSAHCRLISSDEVEDLSDLAGYSAVIVVGGIKARDTDYHVYRHFYDVLPQRGLHTFRTLDVEGRHYCDIWSIELNDQPVYVLAGLSREDTCKAVLRFIDDGELTRLLKRL